MYPTSRIESSTSSNDKNIFLSEAAEGVIPIHKNCEKDQSLLFGGFDLSGACPLIQRIQTYELANDTTTKNHFSNYESGILA